MRRFVLSLVFYYFFLVFSVFLALRYLAWGREGKSSAFRTFVRFALVWFCLFILPLSVLEGLRLVIVALPGLFSYPFLRICGQSKPRSLHPLTESSDAMQCMIGVKSRCGHGTLAVIQTHNSINEWRIRMFRPTDMDHRIKGVIRLKVQNDPLHMRKLIWICAYCACSKTPCCLTGPHISMRVTY